MIATNAKHAQKRRKETIMLEKVVYPRPKPRVPSCQKGRDGASIERL